MSMMLKKTDRPRELKWYQAGAMLYGDWGTSKAYVLGIAFALAGHASWFFLGLMSSLTALIGICYMVICRVYPDGGGVYSSVKHRNRLLAVIGAFLLIADYVITASLSTLDAFHYFNFPHPELWAIAAICAIGALNWMGPSKAGSVASVIAVVASFSVVVLFFATVPSLSHVHLTWPENNWPKNWGVFVGIVLALSGVEAIANMTGIMQEPVEKTSKRAIWPVLIEVSVLTFLLGIAMNAIPGLKDHAEDMLRVLAEHYIGSWYGSFISLTFGFLLLSATNTAIGDLVSIQYLMAKDRELPAVFSKLNRFGMPGIALIIATAIPALVLVVEHDLIRLAALYAIGVIGAITINLGACATNTKIDLSKKERILLGTGAVILFFIELTIAFEKHQALMFALTVLGVGLSLRYISKTIIPPPIPAMVPTVNLLTVSEAKELSLLYKSSTLVAVKAVNESLLEEAVIQAKMQDENTVYLSYIEETPTVAELPNEMEPSAESIEVLSKAQKFIEEKGLTAIPIWQIGTNPGRMIAKEAADLDIKTVLIGTTRRSALVNLMRGNVLKNLVRSLPRKCHFIICS